MKGYLIDFKNKDFSSIKEDKHFGDVFEIVESIDPTNKIMLDFIYSFSYKKAFYLLNRPITIEEICVALSHKNVYKQIANDNSIEQNEFCLIIDDSVILANNWYKKIDSIINAVKDIKDISVISLQISGINNFEKFPYNINKSTNNLPKLDVINIARGDEFDIFQQNDIKHSRGSSCYLIRKKEAVKLSIKKIEYLYADFWELKLKSSCYILYTNPVIAYSTYTDSQDLKNHLYIYSDVSEYNFTTKLLKNYLLNKFIIKYIYKLYFYFIEKALRKNRKNL